MRSYYWIVIIGILFMVLGVYREETLEILINATMICFSCIGLG